METSEQSAPFTGKVNVHQGLEAVEGGEDLIELLLNSPLEDGHLNYLEEQGYIRREGHGANEEIYLTSSGRTWLEEYRKEDDKTYGENAAYSPFPRPEEMPPLQVLEREEDDIQIEYEHIDSTKGKIVKYLRDIGGKVETQQEIEEELDMSTGRISTLLSELEEKGHLERENKGAGKEVRLVEERVHPDEEETVQTPAQFETDIDLLLDEEADDHGENGGSSEASRGGKEETGETELAEILDEVTEGEKSLIETFEQEPRPGIDSRDRTGEEKRERTVKGDKAGYEGLW